MTKKLILLFIAFLSISLTVPFPDIAQGPPDKPVHASDSDQVKKLDEAIAPYVRKARASLPEAKKRFLKELPKGERFSLTIRLYDPDGKFEQTFVDVTSWVGETIKGRVSSELGLIQTHKFGEDVIFKQKDILDWTISKPDGSEEGNFVGNFLDTYQP